MYKFTMYSRRHVIESLYQGLCNGIHPSKVSSVQHVLRMAIDFINYLVTDGETIQQFYSQPSVLFLNNSLS